MPQSHIYYNLSKYKCQHRKLRLSSYLAGVGWRAPGNALKRCCLADARLGPLSPKTSPATASMPKSRTFRAASRATDHLRYLGRLVVKQQRGAGYAALMTLAVGVGLAVP